VEAATITEKERFRRDARAKRRQFVEALGSADRTMLELAISARAEPFLTGAKTIAAYVPMGHEVDPAPCIANRNALIVLPWFESREAPMRFRDAAGPLEPGPFGTPQPSRSAALGVPDVILVPLVAADTRCDRIGQGQGHFDRTLAALRTAAPVVAIGLAWDVQVFGVLPADSWDERLDIVVTQTRTLTA